MPFGKKVVKRSKAKKKSKTVNISKANKLEKSNDAKENISLKLSINQDYADTERRWRVRVGKKEYINSLKKHHHLMDKDAKTINRIVEGDIISSAQEQFEIAVEEDIATRVEIDDFQNELHDRIYPLEGRLKQIDEAAKIKQRRKKTDKKSALESIDVDPEEFKDTKRQVKKYKTIYEV